jgi:Uncharacterized conserved protein (DUF2163)/Phage conserved hypothetical protein BR0599
VKPASAELLTLLATRQFYKVDLWTFSGGNLGATVLRFCSGDLDITANGFFYPAGGQIGPYFDRKDNKAKVNQQIGVQESQLTVDVIPGSYQVFGAPLLQAFHYGLFDGSEVLLERCYMPTYGPTVRYPDNAGNVGYGDTRRGTIRYFLGRMGPIDIGRSMATIQVNSHMELLNQQLPRYLCRPGCSNSLGDGYCLATIPSTTGTVTAATNATLVGTLAGGPFATGAFDLGKVTMTSGALNGLSQTVRQATLPSPSTIALVGFFPTAPSIGDTFTIAYGCNKSPTDPNGCPKFNNLVHFRGEPLVPQPITAT